MQSQQSGLTARSAAPAACRKDMPGVIPRPGFRPPLAATSTGSYRECRALLNTAFAATGRRTRRSSGHGPASTLGDADKYGDISPLPRQRLHGTMECRNQMVVRALMMRRVMPPLTIGDQFSYQLTALIGDLSKVDASPATTSPLSPVTNTQASAGGWCSLVKDSRSCALPRIAAFSKLTTSSATATPRSWGFDWREFGAFVRRTQHNDLKTLPFPDALRHQARISATAGVLTLTVGRPRDLYRRPQQRRSSRSWPPPVRWDATSMRYCEPHASSPTSCAHALARGDLTLGRWRTPFALGLTGIWLAGNQ